MARWGQKEVWDFRRIFVGQKRVEKNTNRGFSEMLNSKFLVNPQGCRGDLRFRFWLIFLSMKVGHEVVEYSLSMEYCRARLF